MEPFIASIIIFAGNFSPRGWAFCQGQLVSIAQNTALFSLVGTMYGGNGQTTFALPDLRGRAPIGAGQGPGLSSYSQGQMGGAEVISLTVNQLPAHTHTADLSNLSLAQPATTTLGTTGLPGAGLGPAQLSKNGSGPSAQTIPAYGTPDATTTLAPMRASGTINNQLAGGSQPHENMMPYLAIQYIIAMEGIYPSRN